MLLVLPIISPFFFAIIMMLFWNNTKAHRIINLIASVFSIIIAAVLFSKVIDSGIQSFQVGSWQAPFGISLVADLLSAIMIVITSVIGFSTAVYSLATIDSKREKFGFYPLLQTLLMGINGAFLTGDIFNLYVWFEVMLISSFVLLALGGRKDQLEGAIKYVTLNLLSSALFLAGVGILYGLAGTLNMADLARKLPLINNPDMITLVSMLFLIAFGIKSAVFPLYFWLPASYHTPPAAVSAIFAGLLTKVGVYALMRVFTLIFISDTDFTHTIILVIAGFTMLSGVLGAASQMDIRKILSFHIISQIGYMIMGLGLYSPLAIAGGIFYIIHHIIVKTNLFLVGGAISKIRGTYELKKLGGLYKIYPLLGLLFLIPALSLAGIPPLSGFWAKFAVVKAGLDLGEFTIVAVSLFVGLLTLFSMTKIWNEAFWKDAPSETIGNKFSGSKSQKVLLFLPIVLLALITITIGFYMEPFFEIAQQASEQLLNPDLYIEAVLGGSN
jgi:multicomponent Na+:H+ antiporter subunit D